MLQTIQVSSCVSVHGELVEVLRNGDMIVRNGSRNYRGRPITARSGRQPAEVDRTAALPKFKPAR
jgi:hypothetical protein